MCRARSAGGRRCKGCLRSAASLSLSRAQARIAHVVDELGGVPATMAGALPSRRTRRWRELLAMLRGAIHRAAVARRRLAEPPPDAPLDHRVAVERALGRVERLEIELAVARAIADQEAEDPFGGRAALLREAEAAEAELSAAAAEAYALKLAWTPADAHVSPSTGRFTEPGARMLYLRGMAGVYPDAGFTDSGHIGMLTAWSRSLREAATTHPTAGERAAQIAALEAELAGAMADLNAPAPR